jgi:hypothetical protein
MDGGYYAYMRDGKKYEGGLFGGDIEEAVHGNPRAEEYARQYKTGTVTGFILSMLGATALGVGGGVVGVQASQTSNGQSLPPTGLIVMGAGLVVEMTGLIIELNALPHLSDAINAYNDGVGLPPGSRPQSDSDAVSVRP